MQDNVCLPEGVPSVQARLQTRVELSRLTGDRLSPATCMAEEHHVSPKYLPKFYSPVFSVFISVFENKSF